MSARTKDVPAPQSVRETLAVLHERLVALGERHDAAPRFPSDALALLAQAGLQFRYAPLAAGGQPFADAGAENLDLMDALRGVGRADLSLGRLFEGHVNALKLFDWYGSPEQHEQLEANLAMGLFYGVWATEPAPGVRMVSEDGRDRLEGSKSFATGAGGLGFAVITVRPPDGPRRLVIVPADHADRTDLSGWRVRGMRATGSGTYDVSGLVVTDAQCLGRPGDYDREPRFTAGAWRFTAVQLGGIEALLAETRTAMSEAARIDPVQRARFADAVVATRTAGLWVREAALRAADDHPDAVAFARLTRGVVERAGLDVMEQAARITGTRSAFEGQRIDKITRDLSLYLRQAGPDYARDQAALVWLDHDAWGDEDRLW